VRVQIGLALRGKELFLPSRCALACEQAAKEFGVRTRSMYVLFRPPNVLLWDGWVISRRPYSALVIKPQLLWSTRLGHARSRLRLA
jgi:hypothetical protein